MTFLQRNRGRKPPVAPSPYIIERIRQLAGKRFTQGEIAVTVGVSQWSVSRWMRANNIRAMTRSEGQLAARARRRAQ